jgi:apolipoprotein N-acyltransferase
MLGNGQLLLAGVVRTEGSGDAIRYYNAVVAIDDKGEIVDAVDKVHLVPFGEYVPYEDLMARIGISQIVAGPMNFVAGNERHPISVPGGFKALPYICYEVIFPYLMPQQAREKDFILNVTNDAWFGDTPGPYQHLRQAQVKAAETGLPVIRSANTGISAAIDNRGRIKDALAMNSRGIIDAKMTFANNEQTVHISRTIVGFLIVLCLGFMAVSAAIMQKTKN